MISSFAGWASRAGLSSRASNYVAWAITLALVGGLLVGAYSIRRGGEKAGKAKVTAKVEKQHAKAVAEARAHERGAQMVTDRIADRTIRAEATTDAYVRSTIEDICNALATETAAPDGASAPAAPVTSMSASLNGLIDRANRAAETPDPAP